MGCFEADYQPLEVNSLKRSDGFRDKRPQGFKVFWAHLIILFIISCVFEAKLNHVV